MSADAADRVAVIGMACRLPHGIDSPERLWSALLNGDDLVTQAPAERGLMTPNQPPGAFLDDVAGFDCDFFGLDEHTARTLDPQHRLLLETSWDALEHAGIAPATLADSPTGVFVGLAQRDHQQAGSDAAAANSLGMASGRIARTLGLRGPAMTIDTACSSGLMAVHLGCRSLRDGESDLVLAGGAHVALGPQATAVDSASPTGRCRPFDAAADGSVIGEAIAVLVLKRLADAQRDGDRILAVIRGTAANSDGSGGDASTPSRAALTALYRAALTAAGVDADTIGMVEAHGCGVPSTDAVEYAGLCEVYGVGSPCALGSVKANAGHTQSASGLLGLITAILSLQDATVPPHLHFTRLPAALARSRTQLFVPQEVTPWPAGGTRPRRAAVSAHGWAGTHVHAIVEQAPDPVPAPPRPQPPATARRMFPLSATSADELRHTAGRLAEWVRAHPEVGIDDLAYTLARRRAHRPVRTAVFATGRPELIDTLREIADGGGAFESAVGSDDRGPVWVFSGAGAQWARMGVDLLAAEPAFAATVAAVEPLVAHEAGFSVTEAMTAPEVVSGVGRVLPTLFTLQVALAAALTARGVCPGAVIGYSTGEIAAAVVAGALSLEDGVRVVCRSSRLMSAVAGSGAMASVDLPAKKVLSELTTAAAKDVAIAAVAAPQTTVIAGATARVREFVSAWRQRDVPADEITVEVAANSPQLDPILAELAELLAEVRPLTPTVAFYSTTGFDPREQPVCDGRYWAHSLRRTVRFAAAARAALEDGHRVFAELAAHPLLTASLEQIAQGVDLPLATVSPLHRDAPLPDGLESYVAKVHGAGGGVDFSVLHPVGSLVDAPLPRWTHRRFSVSDDGQWSPSTHSVAAHPLLGAKVGLQQEPQRYVWEAEVGTAAHPWLGEHRVDGTPTLPVAAYCEMALAAAESTLGDHVEVHDLHFLDALAVEGQTAVGASVSLSSPDSADFVVERNRAGEHSRHARAILRCTDARQPPVHDIAAVLAAHPRRGDGAEARDRLTRLGVQYGPSFTGLGEVRTGDEAGSVLAEIAVPDALQAEQHTYGVHPVLVDACLQAVAAGAHLQAFGEEVLGPPRGVRRLRRYRSAGQARYCYARVGRSDTTGLQADVEILDGDGAVLLGAYGLTYHQDPARDAGDRLLRERLLTVEWRQRRRPEPSGDDPGAWLVVSTAATTQAMAAALTASLERHGGSCTTLSWPDTADPAVKAAELGSALRERPIAGLVILAAAGDSDAAGGPAALGLSRARHFLQIAREVPAVPGRLPRLVTVTRGAQCVLGADVPDLAQGALRGLVRTIGVEHPHLQTTQIDTDATTDAAQLTAQLLSDSPEDETAWRLGEWYTARLRPAPLGADDRRKAAADPDHDGMRLQVRTPGNLETVELVSCQRVSPGRGRIEVAVQAAGVNFADVLVAMGRYPGDRPELGMDFAGVVTALGPGVTSHRVGDRVGGFSPDGCWGTFVTCDERLAVRLPDALTDQQAAAVATATVTAWYGLHELAGISSHDRVLIHSATGGVGQAAIAIARAAGAQIFATAGSDDRRERLRAGGIEHVYDSRSTEFADRIRRDTGGYGVDIVLNSLTGSAQRAGFELLAVGGRFVEIGKRDVYADTQLGMSPFRNNLSFHYVDLALLARSRPQRTGDLLRTVYRLVADGRLPRPAHTAYRLADATEAIRTMSRARHTGKLVLDVPRTDSATVVIPPERARVFRPDGSYVITGGLSALGLFLAEKMVEAGCGRIVLTSRSQPTLRALETIELIRVMGGDVVVQCADIADPATAPALVQTATATGLPVRGVVHVAATAGDAMLADITDDLLKRDWAPKALGVWNLHSATAGQPLDWFCVFSSVAALMGMPGRGAYAAANSWVDTFTRWRRSRGLPATAIAWGAWGQIGRASEFAAGAGAAITPDEGAYALAALLRHDRAYSAYTPVDGSPFLTAFAHRSCFAEAFRSDGDDAGGTAKLRTMLDDLPEAEWPGRLRRLISDQISLILRRNIDPDRALAEYGVDSLGALELRTRIESETGIRLAAGDLAVGTVRELADVLCRRLASGRDADRGATA
ncbi:sulfolipid-1 biosynthesis phthioceranic/hydroxyphthioceranic acid synthase [Mycobacterium sp. WMMD1722]|uniref:sulfolipid-1 biosynthesis phthioceranic/hydroxyphthioceranic acid synthase n=1 Tax=Mycobacterium sp. WMMD1722 TaxID=3404117 RepID=UPI003BF5ACEC